MKPNVPDVVKTRSRVCWGMLLVSLVVSLDLSAGIPERIAAEDDDSPVGKRAWLIRPCYNRQSEMNFIEIGIGRMNSINSKPGAGLNSFTLGSADFTLGADIGFGDTSLIIAPKMGIEACVTIFGGRVTYGYYPQDGNSSGVIGVEGGLCILSVFYAYVGYNFVKGNSDNPVIFEGGKFSIGFNYPFGKRDIPAARRPTHL